MNTNPDHPAFGRGEPSSPVVPKSARDALRPEAGMPPPRRSRQSRNQFVVFLNFIVSSAVLLSLVSFAAVYFGKSVFDGEGPLAQTDTVLIRPNTGVQEIAETLARRGMISNATIFRVGVRAYGRDGQLRHGEYEIPAGASMYDIMELMRTGRSVQYSLTIPEGITVHQAFQRIAQHEALSGEMPDEMPPEGSMMADTERFTRGLSREQLVAKLVADQQRLVEEVWERRQPDLPIADINEFVTLASIVEKETAVADERTRVAGVFVNRLRQGMRLQSDPTIIYGMFGGEGRPAGRPIYRSDIDTPTAYNTYTIDGLPPTPIAIPGRAALEAVANPSRTSDLYFVADGTGGHAFAETLEEHNANVARWRAIEAERRSQAEAAAAGDDDPEAEPAAD